MKKISRSTSSLSFRTETVRPLTAPQLGRAGGGACFPPISPNLLNPPAPAIQTYQNLTIDWVGY